MKTLRQIHKMEMDRRRENIKNPSSPLVKESMTAEPVTDVSGSFFDFIQECERMILLYKNKKYTQAEQLRDKLSERLDDVMRGY